MLVAEEGGRWGSGCRLWSPVLKRDVYNAGGKRAEEGARLQTHLEKRNKVSILEPCSTTKRANPLLLLIVPLVLAATWATKTRRDDAREKREEEGKENFTRFPSCPKFLLANK